MPRARLAVTLADDTWLGRLSRAYPTTDWRLVATMPTDRGVGRATLLVGGDARDEAVAALDGRDGVDDLTVLQRTDDGTLCVVETHEPSLQEVLRRAGVPFEPPLRVTDGEALVTVTASNEAVSRLADELAAAGYEFTVESVHEDLTAAGPLTDRQETVLRAAVEAGYYEEPRAVELTDLAADLDVSTAALSATLRRAEGTLAARYLDNRDRIDRLSASAEE